MSGKIGNADSGPPSAGVAVRLVSMHGTGRRHSASPAQASMIAITPRAYAKIITLPVQMRGLDCNIAPKHVQLSMKHALEAPNHKARLDTFDTLGILSTTQRDS